MARRRKNPVNDTEFTYHILLSKGKGRLTKIAEKYIYILVQEAIKKIYYRFKYKEDIDDSIQTAYYNILTKWQNFNPDIADSAFTYFTEMQKRSATEFVNTWEKMKGIKKEEEHTIGKISINSANNGQGLYNI